MIQAVPPPPVSSCQEVLPDGRRIACRATETLVKGCRNGEPLAYIRNLNPGDRPTPPADIARNRAVLWRERLSYSGLCLAIAAHDVAEADLDRARTLAALGFVRARWEAARCAGFEPGGQGYRFGMSVFEAGNQLQAPSVYKPETAWKEAVKQAALTPSTYAYAIDMTKVCGQAAVKPEAEWPAIRETLQTKIVEAADKAPNP